MSHIDFIIQFYVETTDQTINQPQVLFIHNDAWPDFQTNIFPKKTKNDQPNTPIHVIKDGTAHKLRSQAAGPASRVLQGQFGNIKPKTSQIVTLSNQDIIRFIDTIKDDNLEVTACFGGLYNDHHFLNHC